LTGKFHEVLQFCPVPPGRWCESRTMNDTMILLTSIANTIEAAFYLFIIWTRLVRNDRRDLPIFLR
ncbi:hypothetical protein ACFMEY_005067, partial [Escherichia coli]